ncbi:MoxR family ATPase [Paenibacillus sp. NEAU-GSW1]|uniref:AAA family ATPase n=1 Tax=Paenibacillus sp. NEAU-GSW1 TaxID=2682486 RepID=UPI0012E2E0B9|nr:MoxR family ATPase [Paenibacillus sp. NEAU-GSW1]MUT65597.1 AAA domain-containing protein [Paenibacillus sp. NEAU-GSW1]
MIAPKFKQDNEKERQLWPEPPQVLLQRLIHRVESVLLGKRETIKQMLAAMLAGGHVLLEDVPGVGKTLLAQAVARALGGEFKRIQFTSDMMPADVIGGTVWDSRSGEMVYRPGPIMANIVLADEINRTSPRTQSALLEVMEEKRVSVEGETRKLPNPFLLIATQNPLSCEGTNPLPEAQLDRFMMRLSIGYPEQQDEKKLLEQYAEGRRIDPGQLRPVVMPEEWTRMQREAQLSYIHPELIELIVGVANATRISPQLSVGLSPRAGRDWLRASQAHAYLEGRGYVLPDDLIATGEAVLLHRLEANAGIRGAKIHAAEELRKIWKGVQLSGKAAAMAGRGMK